MKKAKKNHLMRKHTTSVDRLKKFNISDDIDDTLDHKKVGPIKEMMNECLPDCMHCLCLRKSRQ